MGTCPPMYPYNGRYRQITGQGAVPDAVAVTLNISFLGEGVFGAATVWAIGFHQADQGALLRGRHAEGQLVQESSPAGRRRVLILPASRSASDLVRARRSNSGERLRPPSKPPPAEPVSGLGVSTQTPPG